MPLCGGPGGLAEAEAGGAAIGLVGVRGGTIYMELLPQEAGIISEAPSFQRSVTSYKL